MACGPSGLTILLAPAFAGARDGTSDYRIIALQFGH